MPLLVKIRKAIKTQASPERAKVNAWYFKTGKGEYGEGDKFVGLTVPAARKIAKQFYDVPFSVIARLLQSNIHEERLIALLMLVRRYEKGDAAAQKEIFDFYRKNIKHVNNWDLVDTSAPYIIGQQLAVSRQGTGLLAKMAKSKNLWERRIAIIATQYFIRQGDFAPTLKIAEILLRDQHDLIHKAGGWMLREVGNRNKKTLTAFLKPRYATMPRTMLRYAIEKFPESERQRYLKGAV